MSFSGHGCAISQSSTSIMIDTLRGKTIEEAKKMRSPEEIITTASERIGEGGYDILHNNCEHFVNSCAFGKSNSAFVDNVREEIRRKLAQKRR